MNKRLIGIMVIACLILGAAAVLIRLTEDRIPPEIQIQDSELTYTEGESYDSLLEGVTATDNRDGDVTGSVTVENVYPVPGTSTAQVVYVAKDDSNNIAKATRTVTYGVGDGAPDADPTSESEEVSETIPEDTTSPSPEATTPTPTEEPEEEELPEGSPRITLTTDAVTIEEGESINRIEYVESIEDDKDDKNELWRSIQITGDEFDPNTAGTYEQIYYVIDSDGNRSNEATLTITVE